MRAIWKGHIQFSLVTIPVRLYNAVDPGKSISFNLLTKDGNNPVGYEKKDKVTGKTLKTEDIVKGYQYESGQFVIIEQSDFDKIKLKSEKIIEIDGFVDMAEVHPMLFEAPYYVGPEGDVGAKTYALLVKTLKDTNRMAVGKVVLRDRETPVLITPLENGMVLYRLRYPNEVKRIQEVPQLVDAKPDKDQLKLAKTLVDSMTTSFDKIEMRDHYYDALKSIIDSKVAGKEIVIRTEEEPHAVDILTALKASIEAAKKPMQKAKGAKAKQAEKVKKTAKRKAS